MSKNHAKYSSFQKAKDSLNHTCSSHSFNVVISNIKKNHTIFKTCKNVNKNNLSYFFMV